MLKLGMDVRPENRTFCAGLALLSDFTFQMPVDIFEWWGICLGPLQAFWHKWPFAPGTGLLSQVGQLHRTEQI